VTEHDDDDDNDDIEREADVVAYHNAEFTKRTKTS